ncbi:MAG: hypothetical protein ACQSGP_15785 [Frankia sp.]
MRSAIGVGAITVAIADAVGYLTPAHLGDVIRGHGPELENVAR